MFSTPEKQINKLTSLIKTVIGRSVSVSEDATLNTLRKAAQNRFAADVRSKMLIARVKECNRDVSTEDLVLIYLVALCDSILALMGENTMPHSQRSTLPGGHEEALNESCQMQKNQIRMDKIDQEALRDVLWQSFGAKVAWKSLQYPCWEMCRITDTEYWAKDEYQKAYPRPK